MTSSGSGDGTGAGRGAPQERIEEVVEETQVRRLGRPWLAPAIATALALLLLIVLLIPGVLRYPDPVAHPEETAMLDASRAQNDALRERIGTLEDLLEQNVCRASDGSLAIYDEEGGIITPIEPSPFMLPQTMRVPDAVPGLEGETTTLLSMLDNATVFILTTGGDEIGFGSGFFVEHGAVLTNRHVVEGAEEIYVFGLALGGMAPATLVASSSNSDFGEPDLALLRLEAPEGQPVLGFSTTSERLESVVAAGFPMVVMETDDALLRISQGDTTAVPSLVVTSGVITALQSPGSAELVLHTAAISPDSSGGPLVDACGRVVGMNTAVRSEETLNRVNYALHASNLLRFLASAGITAVDQDTACVPDTTAVRLDENGVRALHVTG
jgi:hypothetical protein